MQISQREMLTVLTDIRQETEIAEKGKKEKEGEGEGEDEDEEKEKLNI